MPLLKPKKDYTSRFGIILTRVMRPIGEFKSFCSYKENICRFYNERMSCQLCMRISVRLSTLYGLCSYVNQNPSSYIYAPQKIV